MKTLFKISFATLLTLAMLDCRAGEVSRYAEIRDTLYLHQQEQTDMEDQDTSPHQPQPFMAMMAAAPTVNDGSDEPEIQSMARALNYDAENIILWVKNNIKFEPYNGLVRGPRITAIDRAGNSFDIAALTVAILRAANKVTNKYPMVGFKFVQRTISLDEASNWLGIHSDYVKNYLINAYCEYAIPDPNHPENDKYLVSVANNEITFPHVLVQVNGKLYDPAIKPYQRYTAVSYTPNLANILNAMGGTESLTNTSSGPVPTYKGDPSKMQSFKEYLSKEAFGLSADTNRFAGDKSGLQIIGGREIDRQDLLPDDSLALAAAPEIEPWMDNNIPTKYYATLTVTVGSGATGTSYSFRLPDIEAGKIAIMFGYINKQASIYLDDQRLAAESTLADTGSPAPVTLAYAYANHLPPYIQQANPLNRTGRYAVAYGSTHCLGRMKERINKLAKLIDEDKMSKSSSEVITENLYILGLQYLNEYNALNEIASGVLPSSTRVLFFAGIIGQSQAPFTDLPIDMENFGVPENLKGNPMPDDQLKIFQAAMYWSSMLEHSIIEQSLIANADLNNPYIDAAVSTTKLIRNYVAKQSPEPIFLIRNKAEWEAAKTQMQNYQGTPVLAEGDNVVFSATTNATAAVMLLPKNYTQIFGPSNGDHYSGMGYVSYTQMCAGVGMVMGITGTLGKLKGGALSLSSTITADNSATYTTLITGGNSNGTMTNFLSPGNNDNQPLSMGGDPVDLATGAFTVQATDLALGDGKAPYGLAFTRYHSTSLIHADSTGLGKGWTHSYDIRLNFKHFNDIDLERAGANEVTPFIVAIKSMFECFDGNDARNWVAPALIACWAGEQMINTRIDAQLGTRTMRFVKGRSNNSDQFFAPPGVAATLSKQATPSQYVLKFYKGLEVTFDASDGLFRKITDKNTWNQTAQSLTADYYTSSPKRLKIVKDAFGRTLNFYYSGNQLDRINYYGYRNVYYGQPNGAFTYTDPQGKVTTYVCDDQNRITSIVTPIGTAITNTYDEFDRVISQDSIYTMGDPARKWTYAYAPGVTRFDDPYGNASYYYFDAKGRKETYIDENGARTDWDYDGIDLLISMTTPARAVSYPGAPADGREVTNYHYNESHELTQTNDPQGRITTITPYEETDPAPVTTITTSGSLTTTITYHQGINLIKSITKPGGITETFDKYDTYGRLIQYHPAAYATGTYITYNYSGFPAYLTVNYAGGGQETIEYDASGDIYEATDRAGATTTYEYNDRRQPTKITVHANGQPNDQVTQIGYDDAGNKSHTIDPLGNPTDYIHNADGKLTSVTSPDDAITTIDYDLRGLPCKTTNPVGAKVTTLYDPAQRPDAVFDPLGTMTSFEYDPLGNRLSTTLHLDATNTITTTTEYDDARCLPTKTTDPKGNPITYEYDPDGRQISMTTRRDTDPNHGYLTAYDDLHRTSATSTPEGITTIVTSNTRGLVEEYNRLDGKKIRTTAFDAEGRVLTQQILAPNGALLTSSTMTYDTAGRLRQVTENGWAAGHGYDTLGRLISYQDAGENKYLAYGYDLANNLTLLVYPIVNSTIKAVSYAYDSCNRLTTVTDWNGRKISYTYDPAGRLIKTTRYNASNTIITTREQTYDHANRLRMITERKQNGTLLWMRTLDYDPAGRITKILTYPTQTPAGTPATNANDFASYDADNRLSKWNGADCAFDPDGNLTYGPNADGTAMVSYQYDAHNRLTGVNGQTLYRYNPHGLRVEADGVSYVNDPNAALSRVLMRGDTYYVWGANGLEYETNADGTYIKTYHADHLGSTMLLTDGAGNPTGEYFEYDSYGNQTQGPTTNTTVFRWHGTLGCITDANGLVYMRARYYNPRIMRWLSSDPAGFSGGLNLFAAFGNNPISKTDPLGLCSNQMVSSGLTNPYLNTASLLGGIGGPNTLLDQYNAANPENNIFVDALRMQFTPPDNLWLRFIWNVSSPVNELANAVVNPHTITLGINVTTITPYGIDVTGGGYVSWDLFGKNKLDYGKFITLSDGIGLDAGIAAQLGYYEGMNISGRSKTVSATFLEFYNAGIVFDKNYNPIGRTVGIGWGFPFGGHITNVQDTMQISSKDKDKDKL